LKKRRTNGIAGIKGGTQNKNNGQKRRKSKQRRQKTGIRRSGEGGDIYNNLQAKKKGNPHRSGVR